ncbi:hypothetical protein ASPBRDRAFT_52973 [Aspergillus brasiliensis CBS 101740]|uniref:Uncharacterized protein n=1 Tax=Aspergillus brasiliensis (strain CBS 101740 / IMI 381727 / IBT 21946) TaxID=767769 RepID=A0A1L9UTD2_ASPBC|nr:hypothetical protein ASPBRDRAFT_52973 [Aspergillus brasiliensis CBS 101740]
MSSASSPACSSSGAETMKELLDRGEVKPSWLDRQFIHFLDLKEEYKVEIIALVKHHVKAGGFEWTDILNSEEERRACARSWVEHYGLKYWGTPANRTKYLQEESLEDEKTLCTYPAQREEIARTIAILLERKAKNYTKMSEEKAKRTTKRRSTVKETNEDYADLLVSADKPVGRTRTRGTPSAIRPFKTIVSDSEPDAEAEFQSVEKKVKKQRTSLAKHYKEASERPQSRLSKEKESTFAPPPQGTFVHRATFSEIRAAGAAHHATDTKSLTETNDIGMSVAQYAKDTKFLVTASNQVGMAPVWLPFTDFSQASHFLEHLAEQCNVMEWSPSMQLNRESMSPQVVAASVRFDWSDFEIRVRRDCNEDLDLMMQELSNAWQAEAEEGAPGSTFKIKVMLHIGTY